MAARTAPLQQPMNPRPREAPGRVATARAWMAAATTRTVLVLLGGTALVMLAAWGLPAAVGAARAAPEHAAWDRLRIGVAHEAMPLVSDTRRYTEEGHEVALARAVGERLGVAPEFVALRVEEFAGALAEGRVDAVLTRTPPRDADAAQLDAVPTGYRSGVSVAMRSDTPVRRWEDLRGRTLCVSRAHVQGQALARALQARVRVLDAPAQALVLVRTGECDAALHDRAQLDALFARKEWHKFSATLEPKELSPLLLLTVHSLAQAARELKQALAEEGRAEAWQTRNQKWAANVAFEVYFDQMGPDCH